MKAAKKRTYHHGDLRRTLLDASLALVEEEGLSALSMREVAKRAGVTHAAPYHHFADRAAVMVAIAEEGFTLLREEMSRAASAAGPGADQRLAASGIGYVTFALQHPAHFRVMFRPELASTDPDCAPPGERSAYTALEEIITACETEGLAPPAAGHDTLVLMSWSLVHGLASLWLDGPIAKMGPTSAHFEQMSATVITLFAQLFATAGRATLGAGGIQGGS